MILDHFTIQKFYKNQKYNHLKTNYWKLDRNQHATGQLRNRILVNNFSRVFVSV